MKNPISTPNRKIMRGFTLVELMVVIVIIAVLAALAVAGFTRMRAHGYKVTSMNNLRQLQTANVNYASDRNGKFLPAWSFDDEGREDPVKWHINQDFLRLYRGDVSENAPQSEKTGVPKKMLDPLVLKDGHSRSHTIGKSYGMNITTLPGGSNNTPSSVRQLRMTQLKQPSRTCAFMTATSMFATYSGRLRWNGTENNDSNQDPAYRHDGKMICVFYDGHIEMKSMNDIREIDRMGGSKHPFWTGF